MANFYKWTDALGTVHYGDTPPPQAAAPAPARETPPAKQPGGNAPPGFQF